MRNPKYSIILPVRNGADYLSACVETIISQDFNDYELIISDNYSTDGTAEYLGNLIHPNIKVIRPAQPLSMVEHFEFALSEARGVWKIFLGADDGLQPYFFELAESLTEQADKEKIKAIFGIRSYFFWQGCQIVYGDAAVRYLAVNYLKKRNCKFEALKALLGLGKCYFDLPQMYVTSIFRKELIDEVKAKQCGKVFSSLTPDANLAAICCSLEKKYLESGIPLGWVGSSLSSNGLSGVINQGQISQDNNSDCSKKIVQDFEKLNKECAIVFNDLAGDINFGSTVIYFWESLLQTQNLRSNFFNNFLLSKFFKIIMFSVVWLEVKSAVQRNIDLRLKMFKTITDKNECNFNLIKKVSWLMWLIIKLNWLVAGIFRRIDRLFRISIRYDGNWSENIKMNIKTASEQVNELIKEKQLVQKFKIL